VTNHQEDLSEERRRMRMLRIAVDLTIQLFMTTPVTADQADRTIRGLRAFSLKLFPGKGDVFDLIYLPRFRRALLEAGLKDTPEIVAEWEERLREPPEPDA